MWTNVYKDCNINPGWDYELKCELVRVMWPESCIYGNPALIRQS